MGKRDNLQELARLIGLASAHSIGCNIEPHSLYADKYRKEVMNFMNQAKKANDSEHWNLFDIELIKTKARDEIQYELSKKTHLDERKFGFVDEELNKILKELHIA